MADAPRIARQWASCIGSTSALLGMEYENGGEGTTWFDLGTAPDLAGSVQLGHGPAYLGAACVRLEDASGLTPATTYYCRGTLQRPDALVTSSIERFVTAAARAPEPPSMVVAEVSLDMCDGAFGMIVSYVADGHEQAGTMSGRWSRHADMSDPQAVAESGPCGPTPLPPITGGMCYYSFFPRAQFPAGTIIYAQGIVTTAIGTAASKIVTVTCR